MHVIIASDAFRASYRQMRRNRSLFLMAESWIESTHPLYLEVLEFLVREEMGPLTMLYRCGETAALIGFACIDAVPEADREQAFPTPCAEDLLRIIESWKAECESTYGPDHQVLLLMWQHAKHTYGKLQPRLFRSIEEIVLHETPLTPLDQQYVLFSLGLFFLVVYEAHVSIQRILATNAIVTGRRPIRLPTSG